MPVMVLQVTGAAAGGAGSALHGTFPGQASAYITLNGNRKFLSLAQAQAQIGDVTKLNRPGDFYHIRASVIAISSSLHRPNSPCHRRHPTARIAALIIARSAPSPAWRQNQPAGSGIESAGRIRLNKRRLCRQRHTISVIFDSGVGNESADVGEFRVHGAAAPL